MPIFKISDRVLLKIEAKYAMEIFKEKYSFWIHQKIKKSKRKVFRIGGRIMLKKPRVSIYYNDLPDRVSKVVGTLIKAEPTSYQIKTGNKIISIPLSRIVRIEQET